MAPAAPTTTPALSRSFYSGTDTRLQEFVWQFAKTTRQDILANRHNVAESLGFLGRVVHGNGLLEDRTLGLPVAGGLTLPFLSLNLKIHPLRGIGARGAV
jgi:hypothetical protein